MTFPGPPGGPAPSPTAGEAASSPAPYGAAQPPAVPGPPGLGGAGVLPPGGPPAPSGVGTLPPGVPGPPPGPGAVPPFAAPPTEGRTVRMWLGLGAAALAVLLVCGGGGAALLGLLISSSEALNEQAKAVVTDYLDAIEDEQFNQAYNLLCGSAKQQETPAEFTRRVEAEPEISSFQVGDLLMGNDLRVPVDVSYAQGGQERLQVLLEQDPVAGLTICDIS